MFAIYLFATGNSSGGAKSTAFRYSHDSFASSHKVRWPVKLSSPVELIPLFVFIFDKASIMRKVRRRLVSKETIR